jgi:hypothetical protein
MQTTRPITFPVTDIDTWTNEETGVRIYKRWTDGRKYYEVRQPLWVGRLSNSHVANKTKFADALSVAKTWALKVREEIAAAYETAQMQYTDHVIEQANNEFTANVKTISSEQFNVLEGWLAAAYESAHRFEYNRARTFAREVCDLIAGVETREVARASLPEGGNIDHPYAWDAPADVWLRMASGDGFYRAAAQQHFSDVYAGDVESTMNLLHDEARALDAAREHYATAGGLRVTAAERSAGYADWADMPTREQDMYALGVHADLTGGPDSARSRLMNLAEWEQSPNRQRYALLAHIEGLKLMDQPAWSDLRGDECRAPIGSLSCARPNGHRDAVGHAPVRYPEGTPEYASYRAALSNELEEFVSGETFVVDASSASNVDRRCGVACDNGGAVPVIKLSVNDDPVRTAGAADDTAEAMVDAVLAKYGVT